MHGWSQHLVMILLAEKPIDQCRPYLTCSLTVLPTFVCVTLTLTLTLTHPLPLDDAARPFATQRC